MNNSYPLLALLILVVVIPITLITILFMPHVNTTPYVPNQSIIPYSSSKASWHFVNKGSTGNLSDGQWFALPIVVTSNTATEMAIYADIVPTSIAETQEWPFGTSAFQAYIINKEDFYLLKMGAVIATIDSTTLTNFGNHYTLITGSLPIDTYYLIIKNTSQWQNNFNYGSANYDVYTYY